MVFLSKIYTKTGDQGLTGLGDGARVLKDSARVTAYGDVDELNSLLGLALTDPNLPEREFLQSLQHDLFDLGADLCVPINPEEEPGKCLRISTDQVVRIEKAIDVLNERLKPLNSFILPGGAPGAAWLHLARTVCRRAERSVVTLMQSEEINIQGMIYLNRLSDYLFVLGRIANNDGQDDTLWKAGKNR